MAQQNAVRFQKLVGEISRGREGERRRRKRKRKKVPQTYGLVSSSN